MKFVFKLISLALCLVLLLFVVSDRLERSTLITEPLTTGIPVSAENTPVSIETSSAPETTAQPAVTETPAPQPESFTLSFIGDCTLWSSINFENSSVGYAKVMNGDYSYPFANTAQYFADDDYTIANLECTLSDKKIYSAEQFYFMAPTEYAGILTDGGVDFVTTANNHLRDFGDTGIERTYETLANYGIPYGEEAQAQMVTTAAGLKLGLYSAGTDLAPNKAKAVAGIEQLKTEGAEYIICLFHWGQELYYSPNEAQLTVARACIDAGADMVYGSHTHCLQPIEEYNGGLILYSMGNWSFGGSTRPSDPDTAIVQVTLSRQADGTISRDGFNVIPCCVSSNISGAMNMSDNYNNYQPTPYEEGSEGYGRVLSKLDGSYQPSSQGADYTNYYASWS